MKKSLIISGAVAAVIITVITVGVVRADSGFWDKVANIAGQIIGNSMVNQIDQNKQFGASGDTNFTNIVVDGTIGVSGVVDVYNSMAMGVATTTVCALQSPAATSTLLFASAAFSVSSTTATIVTIAQAATAYATTTQIGSNITIAANAQATIIASTSPQVTVDGKTIFAPSRWLVVGMQGGAGGAMNFSPTGTCKAQWRKTD